MSTPIRNAMIRSTLGFLLCCTFLLPPWHDVAASPAGTVATGAGTSSLRLYVRLESWDRQLQPISESTLQALTDPPAVQLGSPGGYQPSTILTSADGSTLAAVSIRPTNSDTTPAQFVKGMTIRVIDAVTGRQRAQFHPGLPVWVEGMSGEGTALYGWRVSWDSNAKPEWDVLNASNGEVESASSLDTSAQATVGSVDDPAGRRLYRIELPSGSAPGRSVTPVLVSYDLGSGRELDRLPLAGMVDASQAMTGESGADPVFAMWNPGFALSPDGSQIAVFDGATNRLDVIDARRLQIIRSVSLTRPSGLLQRLGSALGLLPEPAWAKEWVGADLHMQYAADGQHLYLMGRQGSIDSSGKWTVEGLGLRLVDVATGQITVEALPNRLVTHLVSAPGGALYADIESPMGGEPVTLDRLDPATLQVMAERSFYDPPELYFLAPSSPAAPTWLDAWPMPGHDPQRTNRSMVSGPLLPHLLFERKGLYPEIAAPDGTIYAGSAKGLVALDASGKRRWVVKECCGEGAPTLAPDGMLLSSGFRHGTPATQGDTEALGLRPDGKVAWRIQPFGVLKGAVPLVDASSRLYLPIVGPEGVDAQGLNVIASDGTLLHKLPRAYNLALAPDGTVFALTDAGLQAFKPDGTSLWRRAMTGQVESQAGPLVGGNGTVYVGEGQRLDAFGSDGALLWQRSKADGALALAERSDGVVLVAGRNSLDAFQPNGAHVWQTPIGLSRAEFLPERPSLIVDRDGTAYVGPADGIVRMVSVDGEITGAFDSGGKHHHLTPGLLLDGSGRLIVSGTDGVMRVYGS